MSSSKNGSGPPLSPTKSNAKGGSGSVPSSPTSTSANPSHPPPSYDPNLIPTSGGDSLPHHSTPTDLLLTLPLPLVRLLAIASPVLHFLATLTQLLTWSYPNPWAPFLLIFVWWLACLGGEYALRYGLNWALIALVVGRWMREARNRRRGVTAESKGKTRVRTGSKPSVEMEGMIVPQEPVTTLTPEILSSTIRAAQTIANHLSALIRILPRLSPPRDPTEPNAPPPPPTHVILPLITCYPTYLVLTYFVPLRILVLTFGTLVLVWPSPWFTVLRGILWRSAAIRWTGRVLWCIFVRGGVGLKKEWNTGHGGVGLGRFLWRSKKGKRTVQVASLEGFERKAKEAAKARNASSGGKGKGAGVGDREWGREKEGDVQFLFTIFENQRWWMGLDWTHALLPSERPSWSDSALNPISPPTSFALPSQSAIYTPFPTKANPNSNIKKTTRWRWVDKEWKIRGLSNEDYLEPTGSSSAVSSGSAGGNGDGLKRRDSAPASSAVVGAKPSFREHLQEKRRQTLGSNGPTQLDGTNTVVDDEDDDDDHQGKKTSAQQQQQGKTSVLSSLFSHPAASPAPAGSQSGGSVPEKEEVDSQGWRYGDNHWDKMSPKGGMGRYTRTRAWIRRAVWVEREELVDGSVAEREQEEERKRKVAAGAAAREEAEKELENGGK